MGIQSYSLYVLANADAFCDLKIFSEIKTKKENQRSVFR